MSELKINMSETTHHTLLKLANSSGDTIQEILDRVCRIKAEPLSDKLFSHFEHD